MSHPEFRFEEFARTHPGSPIDVLRRDLVAFFREERRVGRIGAVDPGAAALMVFSLAQCMAFFERMGAHGGRFPRADPRTLGQVLVGRARARGIKSGTISLDERFQ